MEVYNTHHDMCLLSRPRLKYVHVSKWITWLMATEGYMHADGNVLLIDQVITLFREV